MVEHSNHNGLILKKKLFEDRCNFVCILLHTYMQKSPWPHIGCFNRLEQGWRTFLEPRAIKKKYLFEVPSACHTVLI